MPVIRPDYSSDEYSDYDEYGQYIPSSKSSVPYKPPEKDYKTQLYESAIYDTSEEFICLLKNNSNKFDFDYDGLTLLMVAASHGQYDKMKYLLELGSDPNYNYDLFTPLLAVCDSTKPEAELLQCIHLLEEYNVDFNIEDRHGVTPLMYACKHRHVNIVELLIKKCPDSVSKTDSESQTALFYAVLHNHPDVVQLLLNANAATNVHDLLGRTPLDIAILKQYSDIVELMQPGYLAQQEEERMNLYQDRSTQIAYDLITLFKNNLPVADDIEHTGFYTNVIEMLSACGLSDFNSEIIEQQVSLFQFINATNKTLEEYNIQLNYQRHEILKNIKLFNLHKWKLARSVVTKTDEKSMKLDALIHYIYLVCEQLYINYSALNYVESHNFHVKEMSEKCDLKYAKTLIRLSAILNKYERYVEREFFKNNCLHLPGFIEAPESSNFIKSFSLYVIVPAIGLVWFLYSRK